MTVGLLPVVGIPLPLLSFGGTALVLNLSCIGILQSIAMRREKLIF
jgi:rod shape determining protein RodA